MFESMIQQIVPATWESFGVWIPLAFGLSVGLAYVLHQPYDIDTDSNLYRRRPSLLFIIISRNQIFHHD